MRIFIAAPISGFQSDGKYNEYRKNMLALISELKKSYEVYTELDNIVDSNQYDSPEVSAQKDFTQIQRADVFIFHHPMRMQSSTLIELGYAIALKKKIVIIANQADLPYLVPGLYAVHKDVRIIATSELTQQSMSAVLDTVASFCLTE